jgi:hypothetical protein
MRDLQMDDSSPAKALQWTILTAARMAKRSVPLDPKSSRRKSLRVLFGVWNGAQQQFHMAATPGDVLTTSDNQLLWPNRERTRSCYVSSQP